MENQKDKNQIKVAYCGTAGSFSAEAASRIFRGATLLPCGTFKEAYKKTENGQADFSVLPLENSYAGEVAAVTDELYRGSLFLQEVYSMRVVQNLIGVKGATLAEIRAVKSHPQALAQCADYIEKHKLREIAAENTAFAARSVADEGDRSIAAIASAECADLYGLSVLEENIAASQENATRFAVLGKRRPTRKEKDNFLLFFAVRDESGALAAALQVLANRGFNLKALRSRPLKEKAWHYYFYVEAEGDPLDEKSDFLREMRAFCTNVKITGYFTPDLKM